MEKCIELVAQAHKELSNDNALQPLRTGVFPQQSKGLLATMPAYLGPEEEVLGLKVVTVFKGNHELGLESHQGAIILMSPETGELEAIIDGAEITAMRTAAASAVATKYLSVDKPSRVALIGTGVQAHTHLEAISKIREIEDVLVWNRTEQSAREFANRYSNDYHLTLCPSIKAATQSADIVCTLTASKKPIISLSDIRAGSHINAVGASTPDSMEIAEDIIQNASLFTDVYESAMNEAGAIIASIKSGSLQPNPVITELGDLVSGKHPGRKSDDEITVYKSLGVGIQDLVNANYVYQEAKKMSIGSVVGFT